MVDGRAARDAIQAVEPEDEIDWAAFDTAAIKPDEIRRATGELPAGGANGLAVKIYLLHHIVHPYGEDPLKGDPVALRPTLNSEWLDRMMFQSAVADAAHLTPELAPLCRAAIADLRYRIMLTGGDPRGRAGMDPRTVWKYTAASSALAVARGQSTHTAALDEVRHSLRTVAAIRAEGAKGLSAKVYLLHALFYRHDMGPMSNGLLTSSMLLQSAITDVARLTPELAALCRAAIAGFTVACGREPLYADPAAQE
jgi:hypothetical protein